MQHQSSDHTQQAQKWEPLLSPVPVHSMPTPTSNWSVESMPWKIKRAEDTGNVMEFTANGINNSLRGCQLLKKRKMGANMSPPIPFKQHITEEKITAHFNGLHISNDYVQHSACDSIPANIDTDSYYSDDAFEEYQVTPKELENKLLKANSITVCEEVRKMHEHQNKVAYLPEALLNRIEKPCTALVLWQPPPPLVPMLKESSMSDDNSDNEEASANGFRPNMLLAQATPTISIDDYIDNNNTCNLNFNEFKLDSMEEDM